MARKVEGGAADLVEVTTDESLVGTKYVTPVYGFPNAERGIRQGEAPGLVYVVSDAQIASGKYKLMGGSAIPVTDIATSKTGSGVGGATPVYLVGGALAGAGGAAAPALSEVLVNENTLALWWAGQGIMSDAALTTEASDGGAAHGWMDATDNDVDVVQSGADSVAPVYRASVETLGNKPAVEFDGDDWLEAIATGLAANRSTYTIYVVFVSTSTAVSIYPYGEGRSTSTTPLAAVRLNLAPTGRISMFHRSDVNITGQPDSVTATNAMDGDAKIYVARRISANNWSLRLNGTEVATATTAPGTTTTDRVSIGALVRSDIIGHYAGHIALIMVSSADDYTIKEAEIAEHYSIQLVRVTNGAWSWFSGPNAVRSGTQTFIGTVNSTGSVQLSAYNHSTELMAAATVLSAAFEQDDHNNPAILIRNSDSRIMAFYTKHNVNGAPYNMWISTNPLDASAGGITDISAQLGATDATYANAYQLTGEANEPIYLFWREWPNTVFSKSEDDGATWSTHADLFANGAERPYVKYCSNGTDRIDFFLTEGHPNNGVTSVYHCYYTGGNLYQTDGTLIGAIGAGPYTPQTQLTQVYDGTTIRAWVWDIALDGSGNPVGIYTTFPTTANHRYNYAKWNGTAWTTSEIAGGGTYIDGVTEPYYSGGSAVDPENANIVYVSVESGGVANIYKYTTANGGATWSSGTQLSFTGYKAIRPHVVRGNDGTRQLLYLRGTYSAYNSYALDAILHDD